MIPGGTVISTPSDLLRFHELVCAHGRQLMSRKNSDYSGAIEERRSDVFRNFRAAEEFGIVVRMGDKLRRLENFEKSGVLKVTDESIQDTAVDLINYAVLYLGYKYSEVTIKMRGQSDAEVFADLRRRHHLQCRLFQDGECSCPENK